MTARTLVAVNGFAHLLLSTMSVQGQWTVMVLQISDYSSMLCAGARRFFGRHEWESQVAYASQFDTPVDPARSIAG
jgi:hypothetical protein